MRKVDFPIRMKVEYHSIENIEIISELYSPDLAQSFSIPESRNKAEIEANLKEQIRIHLIQCAKDKVRIELPRPISERIKEDGGSHRWIIISIQEEIEERGKLSVCRYLFSFGGLAANSIAGLTQSTIEFFSLQAFFDNPTAAFALGLSGAMINLVAFSADYFATSSMSDLANFGKKVDRRLEDQLRKFNLVKNETDIEAHHIQLGNNRHQLFSCLSLHRKRNFGMLALSLAFVALVTVNAFFEGGTAYQEVYRLGSLSRQRGAKSLNNKSLIVVACLTAIIMFLRTVAFEIPLELQIVEKVEKSMKKDGGEKKNGDVSERSPLLENGRINS